MLSAATQFISASRTRPAKGLRQGRSHILFTSQVHSRKPASAHDTVKNRATAVQPLRLSENARALKHAYRQAWGNIVALDVEFAHFSLESQHVAPGRGRRSAPPRNLTLVCPGQVCVVDIAGDLVYTSYIAPPEHAAGLTHVGGVSPAATASAPQLQQVAAALRGVLDVADAVVGHGLVSDLAALGVAVPAGKLRCLRTVPKFQQKGHAQKLRELTQTWLGASIQDGSHDAEEDALAAMALFREHVMADASQLQGADLEAHFLFQILAKLPDA